MFTGLVRAVGSVRDIAASGAGRRLHVAAQLDERDRLEGASVAVDGVCLTLTNADPAGFRADVGFETLDKTTLGELREGRRLNLEPALRVGDPLGGHLVSGHVDGRARVVAREQRGDCLWMRIEAPAELARFIAVKGSVCLDGVSLTVNSVDAAEFEVGLVPHTLSNTNLGEREVGDALNLEVDQLARYVARLAETSALVTGV